MARSQTSPVSSKRFTCSTAIVTSTSRSTLFVEHFAGGTVWRPRADRLLTQTYKLAKVLSNGAIQK